jgi:hypothetical protein
MTAAPRSATSDGYEGRHHFPERALNTRRDCKEDDMTRLAPAVVLATCLVGLPIWQTGVGGGPLPRPGCRGGAAIDPSSLRLLRTKWAREQLGLSAEQIVEIGRRLAMTLDPDQEDLIRMILGQYRVDRVRLRDLEDPEFDDDEEGPQYERPRLRAMAIEFPVRAAAMIDRVLTPEQRAALGAQGGPTDPEALVESLTAFQRDGLSGIGAALTPSQRDRLRRLTVHAEGPMAVVRPDVAARLKLSSEQQAQVRAIWDAARDDLDRLRDPSPISPAYRDGDDLDVWMRPRLAKIRSESARILADAGRKIRQVLQKSPTDQEPQAP